MPKYHKTTRIELWRNSKGHQDEEGAWHAGRLTQVADLWACLSGRDYREFYAMQGTWARPILDFVITRPKFSVPHLGDRIRYEGNFYEIVQVNELTGQVGHDMRITCELENDGE